MFGRKPSKDVEEPVAPRLSITGVFGKLKSEADFVQIDSNWREVRSLDETLQAVYSELSRANKLEQFTGCGLLLTGGADRQSLLALVYPSEDQSGRFYPFVLFNRLSDSRYYQKPDAAFTAGMDALHTAIGGIASLEQFKEPNASWLNHIRQQPEYHTPMDVRIAKRTAMQNAESVTLEDLLNEFAGKSDSLRHEMILGVIVLIRNLKKARIHRAYNGIWLPLLTGDKRISTVSFWLQLLTAVMTGENWRPDIIWSTSEANNRIFVLIKPLTSSALQATAEAYATVNSFLGWQDVEKKEIGNELSSSIKQWMKKSDTTLLDIAIEWYQVI